MGGELVFKKAIVALLIAPIFVSLFAVTLFANGISTCDYLVQQKVVGFLFPVQKLLVLTSF